MEKEAPEFEFQGVDPKTGYKENDRVVHKEYGEGHMVCTIEDRAVIQFEEDKFNHARNVWLKDLKKV